MGAPERPLLKPWYRLSAEGGRSVLRYAGSILEFEGAAAERLLPHLLPLLDGSRTVDEVVAELGDPVRPAVEHALALMRAHDVLTEPSPSGLDTRCAELLAATVGGTVAETHERLAVADVCVVGTGPAAEPLGRILQASGVLGVGRLDWDDEPPPGVLAVAVPSSGELPHLEEWNRRSIESLTTWMQVLPFDGRLAAVGPVFVPQQTACHECFRCRRDSTIAPMRDRTTGHHVGAPAVDAALAGLAAHVVLRRLACDDDGDAGVLLALELAPELRCTRHYVYRVPRCAACSPAARRAPTAPWSDVAA
jgi:bacteriocin biosynthesis cyclodehydratase domain-containing protein